MNRLAHLIDELSAADLKLIEQDLLAGNIERLITRRLAQLEATKTCATCGRDLRSGEQKYAVEFGPTGLRQKAWFDELDCLDHFLERMRERVKKTDTPSAPAATTFSSGTEDDL